jgi:hypothetical protein
MNRKSPKTKILAAACLAALATEAAWPRAASSPS